MTELCCCFEEWKEIHYSSRAECADACFMCCHRVVSQVELVSYLRMSQPRYHPNPPRPCETQERKDRMSVHIIEEIPIVSNVKNGILLEKAAYVAGIGASW